RTDDAGLAVTGVDRTAVTLRAVPATVGEEGHHCELGRVHGPQTAAIVVGVSRQQGTHGELLRDQTVVLGTVREAGRQTVRAFHVFAGNVAHVRVAEDLVIRRIVGGLPPGHASDYLRVDAIGRAAFGRTKVNLNWLSPDFRRARDPERNARGGLLEQVPLFEVG